LIGVEGGDSSGISETAETLQERSDEAAQRSPAGTRPPGTPINDIDRYHFYRQIKNSTEGV
jgi:hypothetical protein